MDHICPTIGPSLPCAECTPCRTFHIPMAWRFGSKVRDIVFRRQGYMKGVGDGKSVYWWWEWVPVTPLDGRLLHPRKARAIQREVSDP